MTPACVPALKPIQLRLILDVCCWEFRLSDRDVVNATIKPKRLMEARYTFMLLARTLTTYSFPEMGEFWGTNHSTLVWRWKRGLERMRTDEAFAARVRALAERVAQSVVSGLGGSDEYMDAYMQAFNERMDEALKGQP